MSVLFDSADRSQTVRAREDLAEGAGSWSLWGMLGWHDIRKRYRRSVLGPFWLTISMSVLVASLGLVYGSLFRVELTDYLPFLALGMIIWNFVASVLNEGCNSFLEFEPLIKHVRMPLSVHALRVVWRNLIILAHNAVIYVVLAVGLGIWPGSAGFLVLPGLVVLILNAVWIALLLGMICVRFRDVPPIIASVVQLLFFVTPVMWKPELIADRYFMVVLNPIHHLMEIVRGPLLGHPPPLTTWAVAALLTVVGWGVTFAAYVRFRKRIAYWL
ncbi:MAG TPA: ABC transporter permease [Azospirillum sp.]|nr:ABC transporter permease [Azospirillum sp.]